MVLEDLVMGPVLVNLRFEGGKSGNMRLPHTLNLLRGLVHPGLGSANDILREKREGEG